MKCKLGLISGDVETSEIPESASIFCDANYFESKISLADLCICADRNSGIVTADKIA